MGLITSRTTRAAALRLCVQAIHAALQLVGMEEPRAVRVSIPLGHARVEQQLSVRIRLRLPLDECHSARRQCARTLAEVLSVAPLVRLAGGDLEHLAGGLQVCRIDVQTGT